MTLYRKLKDRTALRGLQVALGLATALVAAPSQTARADIIVDHQPHPYGGGASDTLFISSLGQTVWQREADDFTLSQPETMARFGAWGFYDRDNPPSNETMRFRFYTARASDGLPDDGNIIYEETLSNVSRTATGRHILDNSQREFFYQSDLAAPLALDAGTKYWFEFTQLGDVSTAFRWETSVSDPNGFAFINPFTVDWRSSLPNGTYGIAFQLWSVPEPAGAPLLLVVALLTIIHKSGGERRRPNEH